MPELCKAIVLGYDITKTTRGNFILKLAFNPQLAI
jgi:hypothetical protein